MLNLRDNWWGEQWAWHANWWKLSLQRCVEGVRRRAGQQPPATLDAEGVEAAMRVETRPWPHGINEARPCSRSPKGKHTLLADPWTPIPQASGCGLTLLAPTRPGIKGTSPTCCTG